MKDNADLNKLSTHINSLYSINAQEVIAKFNLVQHLTNYFYTETLQQRNLIHSSIMTDYANFINT